MAGQYRFKDQSGNVVAQISASSAGAIIFSGSAVDFSNASTITLGEVQLAGTASNALLLDGFDSTAFVFTSSFNTISQSVSSQLTTLQTTSGSNIGRLNNLESKSASVDISISNINSFTASNGNTSLNSLTGSYATTGSNTFFGTQTYSGSVYIANDLIVQGSSSIQYISASSVSIGTNIVQLNTANPSVRFAGLTIIDSGSIGGSGSFLYDSVHDEFVFVHRGNGTNVTSSHFVLGPETYDGLGNEIYLTANRLPKGTGKEHLIDSCIQDISGSVTIGGTLCTSGVICTPTIINTGTIHSINSLCSNYIKTYCDTGDVRYTQMYTGIPATYNAATAGTVCKIVSGISFNWYSECWLIGATRGSGADIDSFVLGRNGATNMIITALGRVGIGTTSPSSILSIDNCPNANTTAITLTGYSATTKGHIGQFANNLYLSSNWNYNGGQTRDCTTFGSSAIVIGTGTADVDNYVDFSVGTSAGTSPTNRMRVANTSVCMGVDAHFCASTYGIMGLGAKVHEGTYHTMTGASTTITLPVTYGSASSIYLFGSLLGNDSMHYAHMMYYYRNDFSGFQSAVITQMSCYNVSTAGQRYTFSIVDPGGLGKSGCPIQINITCANGPSVGAGSYCTRFKIVVYNVY
jgi:hypothetical protein